MLWFDRDKKLDLEARVKRATAYYREKYGKVPNLCFIHPSMGGEMKQIDGVEIHTSKNMLPDHFWIGVNRNEFEAGQ